MAPPRTFVCGDVHGLLDDLKALVEKAGLRRGRDRVVFVGDLVDRGPDSVGVLRFAREWRADVVLGNHEEKHLRWWKHEWRRKRDPGYVNPMSPLSHPEVYERLSEGDFNFIMKMPLVLRVAPNVVVVHGGFSSDLTPAAPGVDVTRIRYVDSSTGRFVGSPDGLTQADRTVRWQERYTGRDNVIYGHQTYQGGPRRDLTPGGAWALGLDTGAVFGGRLTGYFVESGEFVSVPCRGGHTHPW